MTEQPEPLQLADALSGVMYSADDVVKAAAELRRLHAEVERLRADAADFHMAYRMKCDEETKAQAVEIERLRAELARLTTPVPLLEREETGGCILWARDEDGWFESARIGATHWTPLPNVKVPK
jgi:hypothetical protein